MQKRFYSILLLAALSISTEVFSFGSVVSDPGSYSYYGTQIEKAVRQIEVAQQQYKQAIETYNETVNIGNQLTGNLQRAKRQYEKLKEMQEQAVASGKRTLQFTKEKLETLGDLPKLYLQIDASIEDSFGEEQQDRNDWVSVEQEKRAKKQKAYKQAVIDSEVAKSKVNLQMKDLEDLTLATNTSSSLKDALDVNNSVLLQMVENQQELIMLLSTISKNIAMASYDGGDVKTQKGFKDGKRNGKSMTDKKDWGVKKRKSSRGSDSMADCNAFRSTGGCNFGTENPFDGAWN